MITEYYEFMFAIHFNVVFVIFYFFFYFIIPTVKILKNSKHASFPDGLLLRKRKIIIIIIIVFSRWFFEPGA